MSSEGIPPGRENSEDIQRGRNLARQETNNVTYKRVKVWGTGQIWFGFVQGHDFCNVRRKNKLLQTSVSLCTKM